MATIGSLRKDDGYGNENGSNCRIPGPPNVLLKKLSTTRSAVPKSMNEKKSVKGQASKRVLSSSHDLVKSVVNRTAK